MHDVLLGEHAKGSHQFLEVGQCLGLLETGVSFEFLFQSPSITKLVDKVVIVGSLEDFKEFDNMRSIFDLRKGLNFIDSELFQLGTHLEFVNPDDFNRDDSLSFVVDSSVNFAKLPFSNHALQTVVLDFLPHR